jgi:hypothetical protein
LDQTPGKRRVAALVARISGWMTIAVGVVHIAFTARDFDHPSLDALWFAGSGLAVMLIGALTLLADATTAVRWTAVAANLAGLLLAVGFGILTGFSGPQGPLLIALFLAGAAASAARPIRRRTEPADAEMRTRP